MSAKKDAPAREAPNNIEAEQALLGAILVNNAAFDRVSKFLKADDFYEPLHRKIFDVISALLSKGKLASPISVKSFLPAKEKVGDMTVAQYLARLAAESVTVINAYDYGRMISDMAIRRGMISTGEDMANIAYDAPPDADPALMVHEAQAALSSIIPRQEVGYSGGMGKGYIDEMSAAYKRGEVVGVPLAFEEIQRVISEPCFEVGNLYGLLSSSGEGKTSLTLKLVYHALRAGHPVQIQSFDQSDKQFVRQMIAQNLSIEVRRQRVGDLSEQEWGKAIDFAKWIDESAPFEVIRCSNENAQQLCAYAKRFVGRPSRRVAKALAAGKPALVITDHIGQITPHTEKADEGTKARRIGGELKAGAGLENYSHLVLQQRNSKGMDRGNPRPIGADLFGGEPAKAPFDAIIYAYRYKKYLDDRKAIASKKGDWDEIERVFPAVVRSGEEDLVEIGALKVRFGSGAIREQLDFVGTYTDFRSKVRQDEPQEELGF